MSQKLANSEFANGIQIPLIYTLQVSINRLKCGGGLVFAGMASCKLAGLTRSSVAETTPVSEKVFYEYIL
jgi:hypothetical protein